MYPILFQIGSVKVPTYGVVSLIALAAAIGLIRRYARVEGLDPSKMTDAVVLTLAVGLLGARVLEVMINPGRYFGTPHGLQLLLHSTGVFIGGLIAAIPFGIFWFRRIGVPMLQGLDIVALTAGIAEGVGRWGCYFSGCCWGTPTDLPWAVTFPEIARRLHAGLPGVPLHPTQIYLSLNAFAILGLLVLLYRRKRFHGQIITLYVVLFALTRFAIEFVRGDEERGYLPGTALSTSQFLGIVLVLLAVGAFVYLDRRHRLSRAPDWRPAVPRTGGRRRPGAKA